MSIRNLSAPVVTFGHVTELINVGFRAERAVSPLDGSVSWVVLDAGLVAHRE